MNKNAFILFQLLFILQFAIAGESNIDSSLGKLKNISVDSAYVSLASSEAVGFSGRGMKDEAITFLEQAIQMRAGNREIRHELVSVIGSIIYKHREYDRSMALADSMLKDSLRMSPKMLAKFYNLRAQSNFRKQEFGMAQDYYLKAYAVIRKHGLKDSEDDVLANLSTLYWKMGQLTEAVKFAQQAVVICRENRDDNTLSRLLNTLGNINTELGNKKEAVKYYQECFVTAQRINDVEGMILSLSSHAMIKRRAGQLDSALAMQRRVVAIAEGYKINHLTGGAYINMASVLWDLGQLDSTRSYYNRALLLARESNDPQNMAYILSNMGFLETERGNYKESNTILREGLEYSKEVNDFRIMAEISGGMYDNYKAMHRYKEALAAHEQFQSINDSLLNQAKANEINQLKTDFAVEEKERELKLVAEKEKVLTEAEIKKQKYLKNAFIFGAVLLLAFAGFIFQRYRERHHTTLLLAEKNITIEQSLADLKETQSELVETERQREAQSIRVRIARDIHDEIGSGLTKITLLSDVARKKAGSPEIAGSLSKITSWSKEVSAALGEIVWAINPTHDTLASLVSYMKHSAAQILEDTGINCRLNFPEFISDQHLHPDLKRNIYLVMKESIHNALKYSGAKNIHVDFEVDNSRFELAVMDDGSGFTFNGFNNNGNGNGLINMYNRMLQVNSSLAVNTSPGNGCTIVAAGPLYDDNPDFPTT